jgi:pimeloyl-ACP methyl ester carboxylesterase
MDDHLIVTRTGRTIELGEYGDRAGHPVLFFHGLVGSQYQASYVSENARMAGLRVIAPSRPGVGRSEFVARASPLEAVADAEDIVSALGIETFSLIGISGGAPYALAVTHRLPRRVRTVTLISGMGPMTLPAALQGMEYRRRLLLETGSRFPRLARRFFRVASQRFVANPEPFLDRLIASWPRADRTLFERKPVYDLFLQDLREVFTVGIGARGLAQELLVYRNFGFALKSLPRETHMTLWHGLDDIIVPPSMAWRLLQTLPSAEAHLLPGGHFMAITYADQIVETLTRQLKNLPG